MEEWRRREAEDSVRRAKATWADNNGLPQASLTLTNTGSFPQAQTYSLAAEIDRAKARVENVEKARESLKNVIAQRGD